MLSPAKGQLKNSDLSKALTSSFVFYWDLKKRKANFQAKSRTWGSSRPDPTYVSVFRSASASAASSTTWPTPLWAQSLCLTSALGSLC